MAASTPRQGILSVVLSVALLAGLFSSMPAAGAEPQGPLPWLVTAGNRIVVADTGQDVILRGANVLRSEWDLRMDAERRAIPALAQQWKGNVILRGFASDPVNGGDAGYLAMLDEHVTLAAANRMYVVFAWRSHNINGEQPTMPDDRAQQALATLARRYHGVSNVIYALQVEPHDVSWGALQPRFEGMVDAIRAAAAPHKPIVMVPGTSWGRDVSGAISQPVRRENIVYKTHPYNSWSMFQQQFLDTYKAGMPVFLGEFGYLPEHGMHMADVQKAMDIAAWFGLGWAAWAFDAQGGPALVTNNDTFAPTAPYGAAVQTDMRRTPPVPEASAPRTDPDPNPGRPFAADVPWDNVHRPMIESLHLRGIVRGCNAGGTWYCPNALVSRGQMATLLAGALSLPGATRDRFQDDDGSAHEDSVNRLAEAGVTTGFSDGTFRPSLPVSREQMASFLVLGFDLPASPGGGFTDVSGPHAAAVAALAASGVTTGCTTDGARFCPQGAVRRDQMASFVARGLDQRARRG